MSWQRTLCRGVASVSLGGLCGRPGGVRWRGTGVWNCWRVENAWHGKEGAWDHGRAGGHECIERGMNGRGIDGQRRVRPGVMD